MLCLYTYKNIYVRKKFKIYILITDTNMVLKKSSNTYNFFKTCGIE